MDCQSAILRKQMEYANIESEKYTIETGVFTYHECNTCGTCANKEARVGNRLLLARKGK